MNNVRTLSGLAIAAAAAALFTAGMAAAAEDGGSGVKVKCYGANACKGHGECKSAMNACKGQNECKGRGFVKMTEKACVEKLGRT